MQEPQRHDNEFRQAAADAERELKRVVSYVNDRVVPEVRNRTAGALQTLAGELRRLADRLDESRRSTPGSNPGPGPGSGAR